MSNPNVTLVRNAVETAFNQDAIVEMAQLFSQGVRYYSPTSPYSSRTLASFQDYVMSVRAAAPDGRLVIQGTIHAEDLVAYWWTYHVTRPAGTLGALPVAETIELSGSTVVRLAQGKIAEIWDLGDDLSSLAVAAVASMPAMEPILA